MSSGRSGSTETQGPQSPSKRVSAYIPRNYSSSETLDSDGEDVNETAEIGLNEIGQSAPPKKWADLSLREFDYLSVSSVSKEHEEGRTLWTLIQKAHEHLCGMLRQMLSKAQFIHETSTTMDDWLHIFVWFAWKSVDSVRLNVDGSEGMNILKNVHIKVVEGGSHTESVIVQGVVFHKSLSMHHRMPRLVNNPRILLVRTNVEGEASPNTNSAIPGSPNSANSDQNHQFNGTYLFSRIHFWNPNLVLMENSVNEVTQRLLRRHGIPTAYFVKPKVIERVAQSTKCQIINLNEQLETKRKSVAVDPTGNCENYRILKAGDRDLICLCGCPEKKIYTIVLRGASKNILKKLKKFLAFAIFTAYNLRQESYYYWDSYAFLKEPEITSPSRPSNLIHYLSISMDVAIPPIPFTTRRSSCGTGRTSEKIPPDFPQQYSSPFYQQNLPFLYSVLYQPIEAERLCLDFDDDSLEALISRTEMPEESVGYTVGARLTAVRYYGLRDMPLGVFLRSVLDDDRKIIGVSDNPKHRVVQLQYVHHEGRILVTVHRLEESLGNQLVTWSYCRSCKRTVSPRRAVSANTLMYSFAKWLEVSFYNTSAISRTCGHSLHQDIVRHYGCGYSMLSVKYAEMKSNEIIPPLTTMSYSSEIGNQVMEEEWYEIFLAIKEGYSNVHHLLNQKTNGRQVHDDIGNDIGELKRQLAQEKEEKLLKELDELKSCQDITILNEMRFKLLDDLIEWDEHFSELIEFIEEYEISSSPTSECHTPPSGRRLNEHRSSASDSGINVIPSIMRVSSQLFETRRKSNSFRKYRKSIVPIPLTICNSRIHVNLKMGRAAVYVRDDEISSLIAYALMSKQYSALDPFPRTRSADPLKETNQMALSMLASSDYKKFQMDSNDMIMDPGNRDLLRGSKIGWSVNVYYAVQFAALRRLYAGENDDSIIHSLMRCRNYKPTGGKSSATFLKTFDQRFILKQISHIEHSHLMKSAPEYFKYMTKVYDINPKNRIRSALVKVLGFFKITIGKSPNGPTVLYYTLMENLFYGRNISLTYDLKGCNRNRFQQLEGAVQMDENLMQKLYQPDGSIGLFTSEQSMERLNICIQNDTVFLSQLNVMDYSLLVGVDEKASQLVVGIIDYIRQYTVDKQVEYVVKSAGLIGGKGQPTIVPAEDYKQRFRQAMQRYFFVRPSKFTPWTFRDSTWIDQRIQKELNIATNEAGVHAE